MIPSFDKAPGRRTFALDKKKAEALLARYRDEDAIEDSIHALGGYYRAVFVWAPIDLFAPEKVWSDRKFDKVLDAIRAGRPLPPVEAIVGRDTPMRDRRLHLDDGIHRYNASKELGLTHLPAVVRAWKTV